MAGNYSAGNIKGNDALSLPDPQTERKAIINGKQEQVSARGQTIRLWITQVSYLQFAFTNDDEHNNQGLLMWLMKNINLGFKNNI